MSVRNDDGRKEYPLSIFNFQLYYTNKASIIIDNGHNQTRTMNVKGLDGDSKTRRTYGRCAQRLCKERGLSSRIALSISHSLNSLKQIKK